MIRTRLHYVLLLLAMIVCGCVWTAGYRTYAIAAAAMATCGAAFLCTQFRTERGVWMGGFLLIVIALPQLAFGLILIAGVFTGNEDTMTVIERVDYTIGIATLIAGCAFATYASVVNFRLFPPRSFIRLREDPSDSRKSSN